MLPGRKKTLFLIFILIVYYTPLLYSRLPKIILNYKTYTMEDEDYTGAYQARKNDIIALLSLQSDHKIAIFHLGGIAIECKLKAFLLTYHQIDNWNEKSRRTKDSMYKQEINNPNHSLLTAIKHMPKIYKKAKLNREFMEHLGRIINPLGTSSATYIDIRYYAEPERLESDWKKSFDYVYGWLDKNKETIL